MNRVICFDLEGPLSPQDNAYELMKLIHHGDRIFEVISRYDDLLALEGKEEYEPGDTLALIVPFLIRHGITEEQIKETSDRAYLVEGAKRLFTDLNNKGWPVYIVSTSYEQHAYNIARRLGQSNDLVVCTALPLKQLQQETKKQELDFLLDVEKNIIEKLYHGNLGDGIMDKLIKPYLDRFYWQELPAITFGIPNKRIEVMGGRRKVWAIERITNRHQVYLEQAVFVGDSITDAQGAKVIECAGGLSIAFNGNAYVVPYATVGVASLSLADINPILQAWLEGGRPAVKQLVEEMPKAKSIEGPRYDWLVGKEGRALKSIIEAHRRTRALVRAEAAKLG